MRGLKVQKIVFLLFVSLAPNLYAAIVMDSYRMEVRKLALKNHHPIKSYRTSRYELMQDVSLEKDDKGYFVRDVYCDEIVRMGSDGKSMPNSNVVNVEHTWPRSKFNGEENYDIQQADLHHLYPTQSRANGIRGNNHFYDFKNKGEAIRNCKISETGYIPENGDLGFEPPDKHKGNVARALFYFSVRYNIEIPEYEEKILRKWHKQDPVDDGERERNRRIQKIQGNSNPFIDDPSLVELISNF